MWQGRRHLAVGLIGLATIGLLPLAAALWLYPELRELEQRTRSEELDALRARVAQALETHQAALTRTCEEWAAWDSMHRFALSGAPPEFAAENFCPTVIGTLALSRLALFDPHGQVRILQDYDVSAGAATRYAAEPMPGVAPELLTAESFIDSFIRGPDGRLSCLALRPVRRNDRTGPIAGYLLMIRPLTEAAFEQISATIGCQVRPDPPDRSSDMPEAGPVVIVRDAEERPVARLRLLDERGTQANYFVRTRELFALAGVAVCFVVLGLLVLAFSAAGGATAPPPPRGAAGRVWMRSGRLLAVGLSLTAGVGLSLLAFYLVRGWAQQQLSTEFDRRAERIVAVAESALRTRVQALRYLQAYLDNSDEVTNEEFRAFANVIREQAQGVDRIGWIVPATTAPFDVDSASAAFHRPESGKPVAFDELEIVEHPAEPQPLTEEEARALGLLSDFAWKLFAPREYSPAELPEPVIGSGWRAALWAAGDQGTQRALPLEWPLGPVTGEPLTLIRPVYQSGRGLESVTDRRANLRGFLVARLETEKILEHALAALQQPDVAIMLHLADDAPAAPAGAGRLSVHRPIELAGRPFLLEITTAGPARSHVLRWLPFAVLICGLVLAGGSSSYHATLLHRKDYAEAQVEQRTRELAATLLVQTRLTQDLSMANQRAEAASQAKTRFLAHMSHELRTPMNAILGYSEQIQDRQLSEHERDEALTIIRRNGQHLLELINDVLDFTKIEAEHMTVECLPCNPLELVREVAQTLHERAVRKNLELKLWAAGYVPEQIQTDPTRLRQILINLIGNAVKFTMAGYIHITVSLRQTGPTGKPLLAFVVADSGIGLTAAQCSQLFSPFSQGDVSMSRRFGGTGLGLAISRRLARLLGGDVTVSSAPGRGSIFTLTIQPGPLSLSSAPHDSGVEREIPLSKAAVLAAEKDGDRPGPQSPTADINPAEAPVSGSGSPAPEHPASTFATPGKTPAAASADRQAADSADRQCADSPAPAERAATAAAGLAAAQPLAGWHILLVEDGPDNQKLIAAVLTRCGARVDLAEDGEQALASALAAQQRSAPYQVILMDMQMPRMDGYTATRLMRQNGYRAPIVALTAHAMQGERERCLEAGCDDYATKPIDRKGLLAVVQRAAQRQPSRLPVTQA